MAELLSDDQIDKALAETPEWNRVESAITRTFSFPEFLAGIDFVRDVAELAEDHNHHPDIDIRWRKVAMTLSTHSAGGLTSKDFQLAKEIDALFR